MASSSQAAPANAAAAVGGRMMSTTSESIAGWYDSKIVKFSATKRWSLRGIDKFSATKRWGPHDEHHHQVLTVDGYSKIRGALSVGHYKESKFRFAGHSWSIRVYPCGCDKYKTSEIPVYIRLDLSPAAKDEVMVRFQMSLLTHAGQMISSIQDFYAFSGLNNEYSYKFLSCMKPESSPPVQDGIQIRCDMTIVEGITTAMPNLRMGIGGDLQGSQQQVKVRGDVTFEVGGHLYPAHKCVLATRCTAFMAAFFNPSEEENFDVTDHIVHVDDMEPRVFEALLHFIYNDSLPEVDEVDMVTMAQGLLVAADRYAMERLKLICGDLLCSYLNDARTAVTTLNVAHKHGCLKLQEACIKFLTEYHCAN